MQKKLFFTLIVLLALVLAACSTGSQETEPAVYYKATFVLDGVVYAQQQVAEGGTPTQVALNIPGLTLVGWQNDAGETVTPESLPLTGDAAYTAVVKPQLDQHKSFLFVDVNGFLWPEQPLTGDALTAGLKALAQEAAHPYFPELPQGEEAVTKAQLQEALSQFFESEQVTKALEQQGETVLRRDFALVMCSLLGRDTTAKISLTEESKMPLDVNKNTQDYLYLLEASVDHTQDENGVAWTEVDIPTGLEPGFVNLSGYLYYVQEDGTFLCDGDVGTLHFDADGRYTSGDAELDTMVAQILDELLKAEPEADRMTHLRTVFDYCVESFEYLRRFDNVLGVGETGWEINEAKTMISTGKGNCYNFAATFWALTRGMGFETIAISGTCTSTDQPHAWTVINLDGEDYFFDPQWQYDYNRREIYDKDMFMIPMDKVDWWGYEWADDAF